MNARDPATQTAARTHESLQGRPVAPRQEASATAGVIESRREVKFFRPEGASVRPARATALESSRLEPKRPNGPAIPLLFGQRRTGFEKCGVWKGTVSPLGLKSSNNFPRADGPGCTNGWPFGPKSKDHQLTTAPDRTPVRTSRFLSRSDRATLERAKPALRK